MNNKFAVGDVVRCKVGGPDLIVMVAPAAQNNNFVLGGNVAVAGVFNINNGFQAAAWYTCIWWNANMNMFNQFNFHEDMLEDPTEQK